MVLELLASEPHVMPQYGAACADEAAAATGSTPAATATTSDRMASRDLEDLVFMASSLRDTSMTPRPRLRLTGQLGPGCGTVPRHLCGDAAPWPGSRRR